jgi:transposase
LIAPRFVKPYLKGQKNDPGDAAAICQAVSRPEMRFVSQKSIEQHDLQALHRVRSRLIGCRTKLGNQIRGLLAKYGIVLPQHLSQIRMHLPALFSDEHPLRSSFARDLLAEYAAGQGNIEVGDRKKWLQLVGAMAQLTVARADVEHIRDRFTQVSERHACGLALMAVSSYRYPTRKAAKDAGLRERLRNPTTSVCIGCIVMPA